MRYIIGGAECPLDSQCTFSDGCGLMDVYGWMDADGWMWMMDVDGLFNDPATLGL